MVNYMELANENVHCPVQQHQYYEVMWFLYAMENEKCKMLQISLAQQMKNLPG